MGPLGTKTSGNFLPYKEKKEKEIATFLANYVTRRVMLESERHTKGPIVRWVKSSTRIYPWVKSFLKGKMHVSLPLRGREFFLIYIYIYWRKFFGVFQQKNGGILDFF